MNLFILDHDPVLAARDHCDKHLVKMIVEGAQILGSTVWVQNGVKTKKQIGETVPSYWKNFPRTVDGIEKPYGIGFSNHPSSKWTRESFENWEWTVKLCMELSYEHERRWGKITSMRKIIDWFANNQPPLQRKGMTPYYLAMPPEIKTDDPIHSYRLYYAGWKEHFASWKNKEPDWWKSYLHLIKENKYGY